MCDEALKTQYSVTLLVIRAPTAKFSVRYNSEGCTCNTRIVLLADVTVGYSLYAPFSNTLTPRNLHRRAAY